MLSSVGAAFLGYLASIPPESSEVLMQVINQWYNYFDANPHGGYLHALIKPAMRPYTLPAGSTAFACFPHTPCRYVAAWVLEAISESNVRDSWCRISAKWEARHAQKGKKEETKPVSSPRRRSGRLAGTPLHLTTDDASGPRHSTAEIEMERFGDECAQLRRQLSELQEQLNTALSAKLALEEQLFSSTQGQGSEWQQSLERADPTNDDDTLSWVLSGQPAK